MVFCFLEPFFSKPHVDRRSNPKELDEFAGDHRDETTGRTIVGTRRGARWSRFDFDVGCLMDGVRMCLYVFLVIV